MPLQGFASSEAADARRTCARERVESSALTRPSSLDNKLQSSTGSKLSKKQKRAYSCALSGLRRCELLKKDAYFLTLTSAPGSSNIGLHWDLLVKDIRRILRFDFEYMKVETTEGNGVLHVLFHSAFNDWKYDEIHAYFSAMWSKLHNSPVVWCSPVLLAKRVAGYMVQYMAGQEGFIRRSTSKNWIFSGFRSKFVGLIKKWGFKNGLRLWDLMLATSVDTSRSTCLISVPKPRKKVVHSPFHKNCNTKAVMPSCLKSCGKCLGNK